MKLALANRLILRFVSIFAIACGLASCTKVGGVRPQGTGEGITGRGALTLDNARVRCDFERKESREYSITCVTVYISTSGQEIRALEFPTGIAGVWSAPVTKEGPGFELLSRKIDETGVSSTYEIRVTTDDMALIEFPLELTDATRSATVSDLVRLPYSVQTFGQLPALTSFVSRDPNPAAASGHGLMSRGTASVTSASDVPLVGIQTPNIASEDLYIGTPLSICSRGDRTYFVVRERLTTSGLIYVKDPSGTRLWAGTARPTENADHRLRASIGMKIACADEGVLVADKWGARVFLLTDEGSVKQLEPPSAQVKNYSDSRTLQLAEQVWLSDVLDFGLHQGNLLILRQNAVQQIDSKGVKTYLAGLGPNEVPDTGSAPARSVRIEAFDMEIGKDGSLYLYDNNFLKVDPQRNVSKLVSYPSLRTLFNNAYNSMELFVDASDNLYFAGANNTNIYRRDSTGIITNWAGTVDNTRNRPFVTDCKPRLAQPLEKSAATFGYIKALSMRADGSLDVTDYGDCQVKHISATGMVTTQLEVKSLASAETMARPLPKAIFPEITNLAMAKDGTLYFTQKDGAKIYKINADGSELTSFEPPLTVATGYDMFKKPLSIALNQQDDLYVLSQVSKELVRYSKQGVETRLGTLPLGMLEGDIFFSSQNDLLYLNRSDHTAVKKVALPGLTMTEVGNFYENEVSSVTMTPDGNLVGTLPLANQVMQLSQGRVAGIEPPPGLSLSNEAGQPETTNGFSGDGGDGKLAKINVPRTIVSDKDGSLLFADSANARIRKLTPRRESGTLVGYDISTVIGGDAPKDCSANINVQANKENGQKTVDQTLARLCYFDIRFLVLQNTCDLPEGDIKIAFTQNFGDTSQIVKVVTQCPRL